MFEDYIDRAIIVIGDEVKEGRLTKEEGLDTLADLEIEK